jgi:hypothetical protein
MASTPRRRRVLREALLDGGLGGDGRSAGRQGGGQEREDARALRAHALQLAFSWRDGVTGGTGCGLLEDVGRPSAHRQAQISVSSPADEWPIEPGAPRAHVRRAAPMLQ